MEIRRQQSGSVVMIWGGMIENELIGFFRAPKELKLSSHTFFFFLREYLKRIV